MTVEDVYIDKSKMCYMNNTKLKRAHVMIPFTQTQLDEFVKCQQDVHYFIENYVNIVSLDHGLIKFKMYDYQKEMVSLFKDNRFSICLTSRQLGKTTTVAAYLLHEALFNKNIKIAVLANKGDTAREILGRIKSMFEDIPWFLKPGVVEWNKGSIELGNGTKIISASTTNSSIRGQSMNIVYLDEMAFIQNDVEFFASTYPVISAGKTTKVIITSTPFGMNLFYKMWTESIHGRNSFANKKVLWSDHPERDEAWRLENIRNTSQKQFDQEHECHFFGSSDTLITGSKLQQMTFIPPVEQDVEGLYKVYEPPEAEHSYVISVDVGEGIGKDYSIINVVDVSSQPYKQVAVYRNNVIAPLFLADAIHKIAKKYNEAYVIVESNSIGKITGDALYYDLDYENILISNTKDSESIVSSSSGHVGVRTTKKTKAIGCSTLKTMIESDTLLLRDFDTVSELSTFIKKGTSFEAEPNKTDDVVMTLVIFAWFTSQPFFEELTNDSVKSIIRQNAEKMEDQSHSIFGFYSDGTEPEIINMF